MIRITTFDGRPWRGRVHILTAGYPCQPFSFAGRRLGEDDPRHLWPHVRRIIGEMAPEWCFFENVEGHLSLGAANVFGDLSEWASASKRACSLRQKSAHPTSVGGSSLWPTPTKSLYCTKIELELVSNRFRMRDEADAAGSQFGIGKAARGWAHIWMLMRAFGATPTKPFSFPFSRPLHLSLNAGPRSLTGTLSFNPNFSDWLMGWPIGWTDPMQPVTAWSVWLRRMRGELSRLPI